MSAALQLLQSPVVLERLENPDLLRIETATLVKALDAISGVWPAVTELIEKVGNLNILFAAAESGDQDRDFFAGESIWPRHK